MSLTACGNNDQALTETTTSSFVETKASEEVSKYAHNEQSQGDTVIPLVGVWGDEQFSGSLKTTAGINFSCSDNFVIGINGGDDDSVFLFGAKHYTGEDQTIEISCDHEIIKAEFYKEDDNEILSEEFSNQYSISIDEHYAESFCHKVKLFVKGDNQKIFSANFTRTGG